MKRCIFIIILCVLTVALTGGCTAPPTHDESSHNNSISEEGEYVRSVWVTYYELQELTQGNDEASFAEAVRQVFHQLRDVGFNTVTVQVRPCADAFYRSAYFPSSRYCFGKQGSEMPYDPLAVMCKAAGDCGLHLEAWVNPYRVSQSNDIDELSEASPAKKWYSDAATKNNVYIDDSHIYFNPAGEGVEELIVNGVREIAENYPVYAIHFDDYFYPTTGENIDAAEYLKYVKSGGKLSLSDFRRQTVTHMIKTVYKAIKEVNPDIQFGISPAANIENDYTSLYADVESWASEEGCCDYIVPQVYFGFKNKTMPFMQTVKKWEKLTVQHLYIGLPLYKAGKIDDYADSEGGEAVTEFLYADNIVARQVAYLSKCRDVQGFYVFSYGCLQDKRCADEVRNLFAVMQSNSPQSRHSDES